MIEAPPPFPGLTPENFQRKCELEESQNFKKIQDDYLYWDKVKYRAIDCTPEELWEAVKLDRLISGKLFELKFGYEFQVTVTDYIQRTLHEFDLHAGGTLSSNIGIAETDQRKFLIRSIIEEAITSSQMEGANTTRKQAKQMIQQERNPKNKSEQMIMNNYHTMRHISQIKNDPLTHESLCEIHRLITHKTLEISNEEGVFRHQDDIFVVNHSTSETVHIPPPYNQIATLIDELCVFFNEDTSPFIHPIIKGCIIHFFVAWIHPFTDGNGRTARALFYWYMLKKGYWLTEYLSISSIFKDTKNQYEKAFLYTETDNNDLGYFITYHLRVMQKAFEKLKDYVARKQKEVLQSAKFLKIPGVNSRMAELLKLLHEDGERILTAHEVTARFQVSGVTVRTDLKALVELGFLTVIQVNKKQQNFIKSPDFDSVMNRFSVQ